MERELYILCEIIKDQLICDNKGASYFPSLTAGYCCLAIEPVAFDSDKVVMPFRHYSEKGWRDGGLERRYE